MFSSSTDTGDGQPDGNTRRQVATTLNRLSRFQTILGHELRGFLVLLQLVMFVLRAKY
jgi:hypothetical protein